MSDTRYAAEPPWGISPFWSRPRGAAALVALAAAPVVAVLGYGWGIPFGAAWAVTLALCVRRALPTHPRPITPGRLNLRLFIAGTPLWFLGLLLWLHESSPFRVDDRLLTAAIASPIFAALTLPWFIPASLLVASTATPTASYWPSGTAFEGRLRALPVAWAGLAAAVIADEPLLPLCAGVALFGVGLAVWITHGEARATTWLTAVSKGRVPDWTLVSTDRHAKLTRVADAHYRADAHDTSVADVHAVRRGDDGWSFALDPAHTAARQRLWVHGILGLLCVGLVALSHCENYSVDRTFIVDRAPPEAVWARIARGRSMQRMAGHGIPGVELWRNCKIPDCNGIVVPIDEGGRAIHAPAVLARVRNWPLREQVRVRRLLLAGGHAPDADQIEALRCGDVVWARMPSRFERVEIVGFNFVTGATTFVPLDSVGEDARAIPPLRCNMAPFDER